MVTLTVEVLPPLPRHYEAAASLIIHEVADLEDAVAPDADSTAVSARVRLALYKAIASALASERALVTQEK